MRIIRGKYGRRRFDVPTNITARPTTDFARENIFNVIDNIYDFDSEPTALDLFAGTGAITFEFLSRGCSMVTAVEKATTQYNFIRKVACELNATSHLRLIKGDVLQFLKSATTGYDIVFADPPYDMPEFGEIPMAVMQSKVVKPTSLFIIEHSKKYDFSGLPHFVEHRAYGSVNFSIFDMESENNCNNPI